MTTIICTQTREIASPTGPRIEAVIDATDAALDLGLSVCFEPYTGKALPRELPIFKDTKSIAEANEKLGLERNRDRVEDLDNYRSGTTQRWVTALLKKRREILNRDNTDRDKVRQLFDNLKWVSLSGSTAFDFRDDMLLALATGTKSGVLAIRVPARLYYWGMLDDWATHHDKPPMIPTSFGDGYFNFFFKCPTGKTIPKTIKIKYADGGEIEILGEGDRLLLPPTIGHWLDDKGNETSVVPKYFEMEPWLQTLFGIKDQGDETTVVPEICEMPPSWVQEALEIKDWEENHKEFYDDGEADVGPGDEQTDKPTTTKKVIEPVDLWGSFEPPELPKGLLPPIIEEFAFTEALNMGCDPAGLAMAALTVCAAAIPDGIQLMMKKNSEGWLESARIWTALVGSVSAKKTPIMSRAARRLKKIDNDLYKQFLLDLQQYEAREPEQRGDKPKQERVRLEDATIEAAQEVFASSPNGLLMLQDEISGWFGSMDKYSGGGGKDRGFWLQSYNGGDYIVHRVKRGTFNIENLSACVLGGIQPDKIREIAADSVDDGLIQRLIPIIMQPATPDRDEVRDEADKKYGELIDELHLICTMIAPLQFSPAAQAIRREMADKHMVLEKCWEGINKKVAAHIGKYNGLFGRLCVLFHCIETVGYEKFQTAVDTIVSENTARRVADFMQKFLMPHAVCFYTNVLGLSDDHESLTNVAGFILAKKLDKIDNRTIQRGNRHMRKMKEKDIKDVFDQLHTFGWVTKYLDKNRNMCGKVNARVHELFEERGKAEAARAEAARETMSAAFAERSKEKKPKAV